MTRPPLSSVPTVWLPSGRRVTVWKWYEPHPDGGRGNFVERSQEIASWACGACKAEGRMWAGEPPIPTMMVWLEAQALVSRAPAGYELAAAGAPGCPCCANRWTSP